eukprot:gene375-biopygen337
MGFPCSSVMTREPSGLPVRLSSSESVSHFDIHDGMSFCGAKRAWVSSSSTPFAVGVSDVLGTGGGS